MRATNTFRALCLGATLGLTGCISVHHDRPDYGGRYESYDSYDRYDVRHVYDLACELGVKGVTIYRDGSKEGQVLSTARRRRPQETRRP